MRSLFRRFIRVAIGLVGLLCVQIGYAASGSKNFHAVIWDRPLSPYAMGTNLSTGRRILDQGISYVPQENLAVRYLLLVSNNLLNGVGMMVDHEGAGHGFYQSLFQGESEVVIRLMGKELPWYMKLLSFSTPFPTLILGTTYFTNNQLLTVDEEMLRTIAGNEASQILIEELLLHNIHESAWAPFSYMLYAGTLAAYPGYLLAAAKISGSDIRTHVELLERKYGVEPSLNSLRTQGTVLLVLNPMLYAALASYYRYLFQQKKVFWMPVLSYAGWRYVPTLHLTGTPFGSGWTVNHFLHHPTWGSFQVGMFGGKELGTGRYYGSLALRTHNLWSPSEQVQFDVWGRVWYQPSLALSGAAPSAQQKRELGGLLGVTGRVWFHKRFGLQLMGAIKHAGFVPGVMPTGSYFLQGGVVFR